MTTRELQPTIWQRMITIIHKFNLYKDEEDIVLRDQLLSTRLYILFLSIALLILICFTGLRIQTRIITVESPSLTDFDYLSNKYPLTLSCSCSKTLIPYEQFTIFDPEYHQVCSSDFITQAWISSLFNDINNDYHPLDFRVIASAQFQVLALFCRTVDQFVSDAIKRFNSSLLFSKEILFRQAFNIQIAALVDELKINTFVDFYRIDRILSRIITGNSIVSALRTNFYMKSMANSGKYNSFSRIYSNKRNFSSMSNDISNECSCENNFECTFPSAFYNNSNSIALDEIFQTNVSPIFFIPGMKTGCLPRSSLLQSTLECFFDRSCLDIIIHFTDGLSTISPLNNTAYISRFNTNATIDTILNEMMIESWHNRSNFTNYFQSCAPSVCTYSYLQRLSIVYILTTIVGLVGGLNVACYIIAPLVVIWLIRCFQSKFCSQINDNIDVITPINGAAELNFRQRLIHLLIRIREKIMKFNMFRNNLIDIQHGIYSTRVYIILLCISLIILTVYSFVTIHIKIMVIHNPTLEQFQQFSAQYPTLSCPCQHSSIPLSSFVSMQPIFDEVCSSVFVQNDGWLKYWPLIPINTTDSNIYAFDFRRTGAMFFNQLQALCNVSLEIVNNALKVFNSAQLISINALREEEFQWQMANIIPPFIVQSQFTFASACVFIDMNIRENHFLTVSSTNAIPILTIVNGTRLFLFIPVDSNQQNPMCLCDNTLRLCSKAQGFYCANEDCHQIDSIANQSIPGLFLYCSPYKSFLYSTLECLYDEECVQMLINYRLFDYDNIYLPIDLSNVTALDVNELSQSSIDLPVSDRLYHEFIQDWKIDINYTTTYIECKPAVCTYTTTEQYELIYVITSLVGLFGGLTVILRIFIPPLIKTLLLVYHYCRPDRLTTEPTNLRRYRLFIRHVRQTIVQLNVYHRESNIEHQLPATRIYIVLLLLSIIIVSIFIGLTQQIYIITDDNPSESQFNNLYSQYPTTLLCPCTTVSIPYFVITNVSFINHPLCSHSFPASNEWIFPSYTNETSINLDNFILITQFRLLSSICEFIQDELDVVMLDFNQHNFISLETIPYESFISQINTTMNLLINDIINKYHQLFFFVSDIFRTNQLQNLYMTNWQTIFSTSTENYILRSIPILYNNNTCNCAVGMSNCTRPLMLKDVDDNWITFPGIVGGCLPIDGLRQSTLECFVNETCVNQLNTLLNSGISTLSTNSSCFSSHTTQIGSLIDELFIESWSLSINYSNYFNACAPSICQYSYIARNDIIYILTTLLGLYGGLTVALRLIVWYGMHILVLLYSRCYRR